MTGINLGGLGLGMLPLDEEVPREVPVAATPVEDQWMFEAQEGDVVAIRLNGDVHSLALNVFSAEGAPVRPLNIRPASTGFFVTPFPFPNLNLPPIGFPFQPQAAQPAEESPNLQGLLGDFFEPDALILVFHLTATQRHSIHISA